MLKTCVGTCTCTWTYKYTVYSSQDIPLKYNQDRPCEPGVLVEPRLLTAKEGVAPRGYVRMLVHCHGPRSDTMQLYISTDASESINTAGGLSKL